MPRTKTQLALSISKFHEIDKASENELDALQAKKDALEKKIEGFQRPDIKMLLFTPIAQAVMKEKPAFKRFEVLGPFGICCEYAIHFYRTAKATKGHEDSVRGLNFVLMPPRLRTFGEDNPDILYLRDHSQNIKAYAPGTMGERNWMNAKSIEIPPDVTGKWFVKYLS